MLKKIFSLFLVSAMVFSCIPSLVINVMASAAPTINVNFVNDSIGAYTVPSGVTGTWSNGYATKEVVNDNGRNVLHLSDAEGNGNSLWVGGLSITESFVVQTKIKVSQTSASQGIYIATPLTSDGSNGVGTTTAHAAMLMPMTSGIGQLIVNDDTDTAAPTAASSPVITNYNANQWYDIKVVFNIDGNSGTQDYASITVNGVQKGDLYKIPSFTTVKNIRIVGAAKDVYLDSFSIRPATSSELTYNMYTEDFENCNLNESYSKYGHFNTQVTYTSAVTSINGSKALHLTGTSKDMKYTPTSIAGRFGMSAKVRIDANAAATGAQLFVPYSSNGQSGATSTSLHTIVFGPLTSGVGKIYAKSFADSTAFTGVSDTHYRAIMDYTAGTWYDIKVVFNFDGVYGGTGTDGTTTFSPDTYNVWVNGTMIPESFVSPRFGTISNLRLINGATDAYIDDFKIFRPDEEPLVYDGFDNTPVDVSNKLTTPQLGYTWYSSNYPTIVTDPDSTNPTNKVLNFVSNIADSGRRRTPVAIASGNSTYIYELKTFLTSKATDAYLTMYSPGQFNYSTAPNQFFHLANFATDGNLKLQISPTYTAATLSNPAQTAFAYELNKWYKLSFVINSDGNEATEDSYFVWVTMPDNSVKRYPSTGTYAMPPLKAGINYELSGFRYATGGYNDNLSFTMLQGKLVDNNNLPINTLSAAIGQQVSFRKYLPNNSATSKTVQLIIQELDINNNNIAFQVLPALIPAGGGISKTALFSLDNACKVMKVYSWDSFDTIKPLEIVQTVN